MRMANVSLRPETSLVSGEALFPCLRNNATSFLRHDRICFNTFLQLVRSSLSTDGVHLLMHFALIGRLTGQRTVELGHSATSGAVY